MYLLGIDYGRVYLGLAIVRDNFPKALTVIKSKSDEHKIKEIVKICEAEKISKIIIGKGSGEIENHIRGFVKKLSRELNLEIITVDETLTSSEAVRQMLNENISRSKRKTQEHAFAAALLLSSYLDQEKEKYG